MKKFFFDCGTRDATASLAFLFLRVSIGLMMLIGHGLPKLQGFAKMKNEFPVPSLPLLNLMSPPVSLMACIGGELIASALLILGLMTRPAAFVFCFTMVIAAFEMHAGDPWFSRAGASKELALMYLIPGIAILLAGAGNYSLDSVIYKGDKRRGW
jgi:putative oxidoreductase